MRWARAALFVLTVVGAGAAHARPPEGCTYSVGVGLYEVGRCVDGYCIRIDWKDDRFPPRGGSGYSYFDVAEYLASEAGVTVLYSEQYIQRDLERGEFRGPDPLTVFKAFCAAVGLEVETPVPGLWVVGTADARENTSITVFARPLDPEKQGFLSAEQFGDVDRYQIGTRYPIQSIRW